MFFSNSNNKSSTPITAFLFALESIPLLLLSVLITYSNSSSEEVFYFSILFCTIIFWGLFSIKYGNANIQNQIRGKTKIVKNFGDDSENKWREILGGVVVVLSLVYFGFAFNNNFILESLIFTNFVTVIVAAVILKYDLIIQSYTIGLLLDHEKPTPKTFKELRQIFFPSSFFHLLALGVIIILSIVMIVGLPLLFEYFDKVK